MNLKEEPNNDESDIKFMKEALEEAKKAYEIEEVPIGAVIVRENEIIGRGFNEKERYNDVTKHAEIIAIQNASRVLNNWRLNDCTLYVTLMPCNMCTGAILQSRIKRVVIGTIYESSGTMESHGVGLCTFDEKTKIKIGVLENECKKILKDFFKNLR